MRSFEGGLEYCHHDGIISPAYTVLKAKRFFESQFYKYLFKSFSFISELQTSVVGIRQGKNISFEELSYSYLPIPPLAEQTAIAEFLDDFRFDNNTTLTRALVSSGITSYMQTIKNDGGVYDFRVQCDASNNPPEVIDSFKMRVYLFVKPVRAAEFIEFTTIITPTSYNLSLGLQ